ncbi:ABC transporter substrate-binding protein [Blastococcus sp. URHD0036]|uniref:ABC transporter substrate-binding protein n=1 Tax=Blastococcus sp. URHD0036 TaxID=1380356 RepID=UPI0004962B05|nr:ABC transporter substrate-binding protein [Blastococcus sp. URHD0036]
MNSGSRIGRRKALGSAGALLLAVGLAACSSPSDSSSGSGSGGSGGGGEGLPDTVTLMAINGLTGPVAFAGTNAQKGYDLAVEQVEADGLLGDTTIEIEYKDSAASAQEAASFASQAITDQKYTAILGPSASAQSTAISPLVDQAGIPTVYVQSGSEGVVTGDYTFRLTPPAASYFDIAGDYVEAQGVKTASVLFNSGNPTLVQLGQDSVPALAEDHGFEVVSTAGVEATQQDFTTPTSQIAGDDPDAAFLMVQGPQYPVAITQLRQAGYDGVLVGMSAAGAGNLSSAGEDAAGFVWPTNFTADQEGESSQAFVDAYREKYGEDPNNYAAEAYDAVWFIARGLAEADSADRTALQEGLAAVAADGFSGAQGDITFDGNDARVPGVLVQWDGSREVPLSTDGS